jgi:hypothetical protein
MYLNGIVLCYVLFALMTNLIWAACTAGVMLPLCLNSILKNTTKPEASQHLTPPPLHANRPVSYEAESDYGRDYESKKSISV